MNKSKSQNYVIISIIIGSIIGLFLDIYEIALFGKVGLALVFFPMISLLIGLLIKSYSWNKSKDQN